jgi:hypothetical protein
MNLLTDVEVHDYLDETRDTILFNTTVSALMNAPDPMVYLDILLEVKLIDVESAKAALLEYVRTVNRFHSFNHMTLYDIEPYKTMDYPSLKHFIQFIRDHHLDPLKFRKQFSSRF